MSIKSLSTLVIVVLTTLGSLAASGQVVESARTRRFSLIAGGMGSAFQPDYVGHWSGQNSPTAETNSYLLYGAGAYVDLSLNKWVGLEAEGRWLFLNKGNGASQAHYLIGPKVPIARLGRINFYGKALVGLSTMKFGGSYSGASGRFTDIAFGGGGDLRLSRKIYVRPFDFEYQYWPSWGTSTLRPYGVSAGIGYRIF